MATTDPFTRAHARLWQVLLAYAPWASMVKAGNVIDLLDDGTIRRRVHKSKLPSDVPEAAIDQAAWRFLPQVNSSASALAQSFIMSIETSMLSLEKLNQLKWNTCKALAQAGGDLGLTGLVRAWSVTNAMDQTSDVQQQANNGLVSQLAINLEMYVSNADVRA